MTDSSKGLLLATGGIDSTVLAHVLSNDKLLQGLVYVDYGQAVADHAYGLVSDLGRKLHVPTYRERVVLPSHMLGSGFEVPVDGAVRKPNAQPDAYGSINMRSEKEYRTWLRDVWDVLTARNTMMLLVASSLAIYKKATCVYVGYQFDEPHWEAMYRRGWLGFRGNDTTPAYVDAFNAMTLAGGLHEQVLVKAPFLDRRTTKVEIAALGRSLDVDLDTTTYSCKFWPECGVCYQCVVRRTVLPQTGDTMRLDEFKGGDFDINLGPISRREAKAWAKREAKAKAAKRRAKKAKAKTRKKKAGTSSKSSTKKKTGKKKTRSKR